MVTTPVVRPTPVLTPLNREFWTGGATGELRIQRCRNCAIWLHPPRARCPRCTRSDLVYEPTSGRGTVFTYTVVHHPYRSDLQVPYVIALIELCDDDHLRITSNIVACEPETVYIGMPVRVIFEPHADGIFVPLFERDEDGRPA